MVQNRIKKVNATRFLLIDKAVGIAILLVVYGHILFKETISLDWYLTSKVFIYQFHMSLFICLSGYIAFLSVSNKNINSQREYLSFQKIKLRKFLPPYVIFSLISILVDIFYFQKSTDFILDSIYSFFFSPVHGSAEFVWYLYVLMLFYLVTPFLIRLNNNIQYLLLAFCFLLTTMKFELHFSANLIGRFFFFFLMGGLIYKNQGKFLSFLQKHGNLILILTFIISLFYIPIDTKMPYQLLSLAMILSILYLSNLKWPDILTRIFAVIGKSSFAIYILNTTIMHLYYIFYKEIIGKEIGSAFIFSCTIITVILCLLIRFVFNRMIPKRVYSL